jgi:hypothetical protein
MAGRLSGCAALRGPKQIVSTMVWPFTAAAANIGSQISRLSGNAVSLLHQPTPLCTMAEIWSLDGRDALVPGQLMAGVPNPAPPAASTPDPA